MVSTCCGNWETGAVSQFLRINLNFAHFVWGTNTGHEKKKNVASYAVTERNTLVEMVLLVLNNMSLTSSTKTLL